MGVVVCVQDTERIRIEKSEEFMRLTLRKVMRKDDGVYPGQVVHTAVPTSPSVDGRGRLSAGHGADTH